MRMVDIGITMNRIRYLVDVCCNRRAEKRFESEYSRRYYQEGRNDELRLKNPWCSKVTIEEDAMIGSALRVRLLSLTMTASTCCQFFFIPPFGSFEHHDNCFLRSRLPNSPA